jgi:hypothetical protein
MTELISITIDHKLHKGQFGCHKQHSVIDATTVLTMNIHKGWDSG